MRPATTHTTATFVEKADGRMMKLISALQKFSA